MLVKNSSRNATTRVRYSVFLNTVRKLLLAGACLSFLAALFFAYGHIEERHVLHLFLSELQVDDRLSTDDLVQQTSKAIYERTNNTMPPSGLTLCERIEAFSPANITTAVSLKYGIYIVDGHPMDGPCGTMSRVLLNSLWSHGVKARKVHLVMPDGNGHTMVEYLDEGMWKLISPSDKSFVWRNAEGDVASIEEIQADESVFRQIHSVCPEYPYNFDHPIHFNWDRLPAFVEQRASASWGQGWCDEFETPWLIDQPRLLACLFWLFASLTCILFSVTLWYVRRRGRTRWA